MALQDRLIQDRLKKLQDIKDLGLNPYPYSFDKKHEAKKLQEEFKELKEEEKTDSVVKVAGRILNFRRMGKVAFIKLRDDSGDIQVYAARDVLGEEIYERVKKCDMGDFIGVTGTIFKTKTGEITVEAKEYEILTKTIQPLPDKFHGIQDKELRYRKRYLDLIMNPDVKEVFRKRSIMIKAIRDFLDERGLMEVETPALQTQYGGASARPFVTHINAWDMPMYLSISPELYLKRLIVGGFENIYTICKNFRNEGVDHSHNPEFTMIEIYQAYKDYNDMMTLMEECYEYVCKRIHGTTIVKHKTPEGQEIEIDFKAPWKRQTIVEAIKEILDIDVSKMSTEELEDYCIKNNLEFSENTWHHFVYVIFDELVENKIMQPTHVYDRPKGSSPLCKQHRTDENFIEQCEPICMGMEIGNMYSELNDPILQEQLLQEQVEKGRGGDDEAHPMDEDFVESMKVGMPPTGGIGWGVDRMAIVLLGQEAIRDVIFFPTMKPVAEKEDSKDKKKK